MSKQLKETFNKKMDIHTSASFDKEFFKKLDHEAHKPYFFSRYLPWAMSGLATLSVLFIALNISRFSPQTSPKHREYIDSVIELQNSMDESISSDSQTDTMDLTSAQSDEI